MKNDLSDDKFDQMMRQLMNDAALDDGEVNDIADSPTIWWAVQRGINEQRTARSPWPPVKPWKRLLMIGVPAMAALVIAVAFMVNQRTVESDVATQIEKTPASPPTVAAPTQTDIKQDVIPEPSAMTTTHLSRAQAVKAPFAAKSSRAKVRAVAVAASRTEIKTDFIALSYARDPDSGQVVRVRVPSSMMVSLGLVASVKKPTDMVDAEVLVGDDGLTRAIRFIR